ncbi:MAG TPA: TetR/AcrR family transcriptional regulator [Caldisericia bacterium]|nr:TetR/AcrR family transcriptional regulator [Caldisericia bacterium]HPF49566.1 TetR/AcrR family transcriptional regulator [Caldisericia bacterium]HPI84518.1 TetR/AcrR family transcriptional regulator [Caldisericia bacterium]HPQ93884.1 TetR/AcrR family transcriptional regulator [Caldisericia bacterium]HRV75429.1 TetR/AcrR family transcriptional regulator [Caldisericia bacterium]
MNKRQQQKEETKQRIIETARELFARKSGFRDTSTLDVAKVAGVSHGSVFAHFATREDLVFTIIESELSLVISSFSGLVEKHENSESITLEMVARYHIASLVGVEEIYKQSVMEYPHFSNESKMAFLSYYSALSEIFISVAKKSNLTTSVEYEKLFSVWISLLHHYLINADLYSDCDSVLEKKGSEIVALYLSLVTPRK